MANKTENDKILGLIHKETVKKIAVIGLIGIGLIALFSLL